MAFIILYFCYTEYMVNLYDILYKEPALKRYQMPSELEGLARKLVLSGRMRVEAYEQSNFVRFSRPSEGVNRTFSYRELCDATHLERTKQIIRNSLSGHFNGIYLEEKVTSEFVRLQEEVKKIFGIDSKTELMLARVIVQTAEPVVIMLLLEEHADLFISYSYNIGDMLDIQAWKDVGSNSGLQSVDMLGAGVFISCDGDPFVSNSEKRHNGEGFNALARLMIIGGQELGHFADLIRNENGIKVGRHSAYAHRPKKQVGISRLDDIDNCYRILDNLNKLGLQNLKDLESRLHFFIDKKRKGFVRISASIRVYFITRKIIASYKKYNLKFLKDIKKDKYNHIGCKISDMILDMLFNLEPKADVYKRSNPKEEEAIACIEALARVPQQVNKWGHTVTKAMTPNLYQIYYQQVIPSCIKAYENISNKPYNFKVSNKMLPYRIIQRLFAPD